MLDKENARFVKVCILMLGLAKRVNVKIAPGKVTPMPDVPGLNVCGWYQEPTDLADFHSICVALGAVRGWREIVAHELAHAWCVENHPKAADHGRTFQRIAAGMRRGLRDWGYNLGAIYQKEIDK